MGVMGKGILLLILGALLILSGCSRGSESSENSDTSLLAQWDNGVGFIQLDNVAELISPGTQNLSATDVARGANDFAFRLSTALLEDAGHDNFVFSPYSVWMPLAALVNATNEEHKPALIEALGAGGISQEDINQAASRMLFNLTNERARREGWGEWGGNEESPLHIANAIFVDYNWPLRREFAQTFADYYRGSAMNLDFSSQAAVDAVNQWASDNTNGLINNIIQEFNPDTVAAIANAIYFSGSWLDQFNPNSTIRDTFYSPIGESEAYFMQRRGFFTYFEDEKVQAVNLSFADWSGMKIILPKDGDAVGFLSSMTSECFDIMQNNSALGEGTLKLPRFSIENTIDNLADALITLGVPLFDQVAAPLTGGLIYDEGELVWLNNAVQVAMIEVDEEGAIAAAVTIYDISVTSAPEPEITFEMICNTPFVFILHSNTRDGGRQILFMGVVNQP